MFGRRSVRILLGSLAIVAACSSTVVISSLMRRGDAAPFMLSYHGVSTCENCGYGGSDPDLWRYNIHNDY